MEQPVLSNPDVYPTDEVLHSHLGKAKASFDSLFEYNHETFPDFAERWKYYNDGKNWLLNVSRKKKTLFWLSVWDGWFRTTFYLNPKAAECVRDLDIPKDLKKQFKETAGKKFRGLTVVIKAKKDVKVYKEILALKMASM
ncbi:MAG: DUF3788 family protein [Bacteroidota bacterium]